jgi:hypothetical protein
MSYKFAGTVALVALCVACSGVGDERYAAADAALETAGEDLEGEGPCAAVAEVPSDCPTDIEWRNHGQYVSCVAKYFAARLQAGDISEDDHAALVEIAALSDVGMPAQAGGAAAGGAIPDGLPDETEPGVDAADGGPPDFSSHFAGACAP